MPEKKPDIGSSIISQAKPLLLLLLTAHLNCKNTPCLVSWRRVNFPKNAQYVRRFFEVRPTGSGVFLNDVYYYRRGWCLWPPANGIQSIDTNESSLQKVIYRDLTDTDTLFIIRTTNISLSSRQLDSQFFSYFLIMKIPNSILYSTTFEKKTVLNKSITHANKKIFKWVLAVSILLDVTVRKKSNDRLTTFHFWVIMKTIKDESLTFTYIITVGSRGQNTHFFFPFFRIGLK